MNNKGYNSDWLERLKFNSDIVSIISKYVTLQQKGKSHWGCCPFHSEKTPSFSVNGVEQFFHCFGCGASGDVISFIQKIESVDFMEAVKILADSAGMEVPAYVGDENVKKNKEKKDLYILANKEAAIYYNKILFTEKGKSALDYLYKRGLTKEVITKFGLGASPDWTSLVNYLRSKNFKMEDLKEAGLIEKGQKGNYYDIMAERLMFPIINSYGSVIGFSARSLKDGKFAKYRNTAQTFVFDKSRVVYGINLLKKLKQNEGLKEIIVVEGQMDVIALHSAGFSNTVACMGTALTKYHSKELKRFADKVIISFDGDGAGQKATLRSLDILQDEGLNVYVISMPEGLDPDEYIKKYGKDSYAKLVTAALPLNDYKINAIASKYNLSDNRQVTKFVNEALITVKEIKNSSERQIYLNLISQKSKINVDTLARDLQYINSKKVEINKDDEDETNIKDPNFMSAEFILASLIHKKSWLKTFADFDFINVTHKKLYDYIIKSQNLGKEIKVSNLFDVFDVENNTELKAIINYNFNTIKNLERYYMECTKNLELNYLIAKQKTIIENFEKATDKQIKLDLMKQLQEITNDIKNKKMEG